MSEPEPDEELRVGAALRVADVEEDAAEGEQAEHENQRTGPDQGSPNGRPPQAIDLAGVSDIRSPGKPVPMDRS